MLFPSGKIRGNQKKADEDGDDVLEECRSYKATKSLFVGGPKSLTESFNTDCGGLFWSDDKVGQSVGRGGRGENRTNKQRRRGEAANSEGMS